MYAQYRDSGVPTIAPKIGSAKPTSEAPSTLAQGMRRSLREVARKLRGINPQWKQYSMLCGASIMFLGIFATQELVSERRRLPTLFQAPLRLTEPKAPEVVQEPAPPAGFDETPHSPHQQPSYMTDHGDDGDYQEQLRKFQQYQQDERQYREELEAYQNAVKEENDRAWTNHPWQKPSEAKEKPLLDETMNENGDNSKVWILLSLASVAAAPIIYNSMDSVQAAVMTGGWEAYILLPILMLVPFLLLGYLNGGFFGKQMLFNTIFAGGVLSLSAFGMLSIQKAAETVHADAGSKIKFDNQIALDAFRCVSLVLIFVAVWWFVLKSFYILNDGFKFRKGVGMLGAISFAIGASVLMIAQMGGDVINMKPDTSIDSSSWQHTMSEFGIIAIVVGLGIFGLMFALQQKDRTTVVLAVGNAVALGFIAVNALALMNTSPEVSSEIVSGHVDVMLICGFAVAIFGLFCFFGRTNFKCAEKGGLREDYKLGL